MAVGDRIAVEQNARTIVGRGAQQLSTGLDADAMHDDLCVAIVEWEQDLDLGFAG